MLAVQDAGGDQLVHAVQHLVIRPWSSLSWAGVILYAILTTRAI
jgi:hypothetical protein